MKTQSYKIGYLHGFRDGEAGYKPGKRANWPETSFAYDVGFNQGKHDGEDASVPLRVYLASMNQAKAISLVQS